LHATPASYIQTSSPGDRKAVNVGVSTGGGIQIPVNRFIALDFIVQDNLGLSNIYKAPAGMGKTTKK